MSGETFARLVVSSPAEPEIEADKLELSADWRAHPPVLLDIGPVLHPDDAVANKMCALYGRALPRDFLDVDAAISSGRYGRDRLIELAKNADNGFDEQAFADALGALTQITDDAFAEYGTRQISSPPYAGASPNGDGHCSHNDPYILRDAGQCSADKTMTGRDSSALTLIADST